MARPLTPLHVRMACIITRTFENCSYADASFGKVAQFLREGSLALKEPPHENTWGNWYSHQDLIPAFEEMLMMLARVGRNIDWGVTLDATGISVNREVTNWIDGDRGTHDFRGTDWIKVHAAVMTQTNLIAAMNFTKCDGHGSADTMQAISLLERVAKGSGANLRALLADKAYLDEKILKWAMKHGIKSFIPIKKKWAADNRSAIVIEYATGLEELYKTNRALFDEVYRFRSKIESVFSALKWHFDHYTWARGKFPTAEEAARIDSGDEALALKFYGDVDIWQFPAERVPIAFKIDMLARAVCYDIRRIVVMEQFHDEKVLFSVDRAFRRPIKGIDYDQEYFAVA